MKAPPEMVLAPMEGLLDFVLRDILTRCGGIDRCVSEFVRITNVLLPPRVYQRMVPELQNHGRTRAGVPVRVQLLGSDPACLADNAGLVAALGSHGVDLNFGCPAKVVNRHGGGAALLEDPALLYRIMQAVRQAVPPELPVSAKMRLGFMNDNRAEECALALAEGGADELVIHARTKAEGYHPPAHWERIADLRAVIAIPLIANGEIWTPADARRCRTESACSSLMLGRGMVRDPGLANAIRRADTGIEVTAGPGMAWVDLLPHISDFWQIVRTGLDRKKHAGRLKQWLNFLRHSHPQAQAAYDQVKTIDDPRQIDPWLAQLTATCRTTAFAA